MTTKTKFQKEYEKLYKSINLKVERDFICEGFLKGSLSAFEREFKFFNMLENNQSVIKIKQISDKIEELNKDIEFCKKKLEDFK